MLAELQTCENKSFYRILEGYQFITNSDIYLYRDFIEKLHQKRMELKKENNPLLITGFGTSINVDKRKLIITNNLKGTRLEFYPHKINHDGIIIDCHTGNITFEAMRWNKLSIRYQFGFESFLFDINSAM